MATGTIVSELSSRQFLSEIDVAVAIYADAMDADPALLPGRRDLMRRHAGYPAFRALHARVAIPGPRVPAGAQPPAEAQPGEPDLAVVGFAYGFHGLSGQWWYDAVWSALTSTIGIRRASSWLSDCLEVAEVHVDKRYQRAGIGTRMLSALTAGRGERTAMLSTPDRDTTARRLYRRMGFTELLVGYSFPGGSPPYVLMGAELPLRDPVAAPIRDLSASPSIS